METKEHIKTFCIGFFKNLKSEVEEKEDIIEVKNVPKEFEEFYGKKSPYSLVFDPEKNNDNAELIVKGSYLLKAMTKYLENHGQTTLLKMNFEIDPKEELKKYLRLKNCEIANYTKIVQNDFIIRFTFQTTFQYLNEKEQILNSIYVYNNEVVENFDPSNFPLIEGKKEDMIIKDFKEPYSIAKSYLKSLLENKTNQVSNLLSKKLEKEINRVKEHYASQITENDNLLMKHQEQLTALELQLPKSLDKESKQISQKIKRLKETIESLKKSDAIDKLKKEEDFFINDEIYKHGLGINNKLINTTIIYYPIFKFSLFIKNNLGGTMINMEFNPLFKKLSPIKCESCKKEIKEIFLCETGHLSCNNCLGRCIHCGGDFCTNCLNRICDICSTRICRRCAVRCLSCGKYICKNHMTRNPKTGRQVCTTCANRG